ncbi:MAG: dienelactone hydrolase family protein, partial [Dehalococcoidia bacterium]|nr:dienelactone hydrolase family protein [Dehalococcoidia bacterium]
ETEAAELETARAQAQAHLEKTREAARAAEARAATTGEALSQSEVALSAIRAELVELDAVERSLEEALKKHGKTYEFHTYENAGHAFFAVNRPNYRPHAAVDGWEKVFAWFEKYL